MNPDTYDDGFNDAMREAAKIALTLVCRPAEYDVRFGGIGPFKSVMNGKELAKIFAAIAETRRGADWKQTLADMIRQVEKDSDG